MSERDRRWSVACGGGGWRGAAGVAAAAAAGTRWRTAAPPRRRWTPSPQELSQQVVVDRSLGSRAHAHLLLRREGLVSGGGVHEVE